MTQLLRDKVGLRGRSTARRTSVARRLRLVLLTAGVFTLSTSAWANGTGTWVCGGSADGSGTQDGNQSVANGDFSVSCGYQNATEGFLSVAIGAWNVAAQSQSTAVGWNNYTSGLFSVAVGSDNGTSGEYSATFGAHNSSGGANSMAFGNDNAASGDSGTAIGNVNTASGLSSTALGEQNTASNRYSVAIGFKNTASGASSLAFGRSSNAGGASNNSGAIAIGVKALAGIGEAGAVNAIAVGNDAQATARNSAAYGTLANATATAALALGTGAKATESYAVAIGFRSVADDVNVVSVGAAGAERRIINVRPAVNATDAVNLAQVKALIAASTAVASSLPPRKGPRFANPSEGRGLNVPPAGGNIGASSRHREAQLASLTNEADTFESESNSARPGCEFSASGITAAVTQQAAASPAFEPAIQSAVSFRQGAPGCAALTFTTEALRQGGGALEVTAVLDGALETLPWATTLPSEPGAQQVHTFSFLFPKVSAGPHRIEVRVRNAGAGGLVKLGTRTSMVQYAR